MRFLIDRGIDMTIKDYRWDSTAASWALSGNNDEKMAQWLEEAERQREHGRAYAFGRHASLIPSSRNFVTRAVAAGLDRSHAIRTEPLPWHLNCVVTRWPEAASDPSGWTFRVAAPFVG